MNNDSGDGHAPTSYDPGDLPEGGLAELEIEQMQKRLRDERKAGMKKYTESQLIPESEGFE